MAAICCSDDSANERTGAGSRCRVQPILCKDTDFKFTTPHISLKIWKSAQWSRRTGPKGDLTGEKRAASGTGHRHGAVSAASFRIRAFRFSGSSSVRQRRRKRRLFSGLPMKGRSSGRFRAVRKKVRTRGRKFHMREEISCTRGRKSYTRGK